MSFIVWDQSAQYKAIILVKLQSLVITWRVRVYPLDSQLTLQADKFVQPRACAHSNIEIITLTIQF